MSPFFNQPIPEVVELMLWHVAYHTRAFGVTKYIQYATSGAMAFAEDPRIKVGHPLTHSTHHQAATGRTTHVHELLRPGV